MNKVRILGVGAIIIGTLIGYYSPRTDIHLLSGMLLGLGIGWLITGKLIVPSKSDRSRLERLDQ